MVKGKRKEETIIIIGYIILVIQIWNHLPYYYSNNRTADYTSKENDMLNKYLFLDINGVLDTYRYREILKKYSQHFIDENGLLYDPKVILNLERIIEATDAKIVITSTWRLYDDMKALWHSWGLAGEVVGVTSTYHPRWDKALKRFTCILIPKQGFEVEEWLKSNATEPYNYAILDDKDDKDYFLPHQANHLVLTNPYDGLTKEIADRVIEILLR